MIRFYKILVSLIILINFTNVSLAQGFSKNEDIRILLDSNEKIVEIKYSSGGTFIYSCSKLK